MATRTVDMIRHELNNEYRFLYEIGNAFGVLTDLGYEESPDPDERSRFRQLRGKLTTQKEKVDRLESELQRALR